MYKFKNAFIIIVLIVAALAYISIFSLKIPMGAKNINIKGLDQMRYGIDIRGGVEAVYKAKDLDRVPTSAELESALTVIETRLDAKNILDREITINKEEGSILVRFPWKTEEKEFNPQQAIAELGETARLTFRDPEGNVVVEGKNVKKSIPEFDNNKVEQVVRLEFDEEGKRLFSEATGRLVNQKIGIYMDEELISAPTVQTQITEGTAVITGMKDAKEAKELSDKINSGSLPFSLISSNHSTISPKLGSGALGVMAKAGIVAFILICIFMILYYRLPGVVACVALILQATGQLLALSVPQITLTLPGIAAVILSIGMGVDANIIVSERIKEEIRSGKKLSTAITSGFHRAFSSVFDGNITVIIVAIILMIFGSGAMLSFAYSLFTGVMLNFLAGVTASRLMISSLSNYKPLKNPVLYGARRTAK